ncbi:TPA: hypothetical protein HA249_00725 [Candidatus Woesearchaeota archaeon]|nr:MAG: Glutamate-cysteine ligase, GCS2 [archaeon GW2011_AR16]HIG95401.1 hypothetical protein [Candidatus Woesearchaeota archaeon]
MITSGVLFGPELEFFVVDQATLKPRNIHDVLATHPGFGTTIKPELAAEQIEIAIPPSHAIQDLEERLYAVMRDVLPLVEQTGAMLLPVPLLDTETFTITPSPRYQLLLDTLGENFRKHAVAVASDQINIGAENEAQAFRIFNAVRFFLPEFMGYSVASPFSQGKPTGVASNRMNFYDRAITRFSHLTGIPPELSSLEAYARELEELPIFQHPNMFYKYARPMPHRGVAAEIRCMDKQPTIRDYLAFVALAKAIVYAAEALKEQGQYAYPPYTSDDIEIFPFRLLVGENGRQHLDRAFEEARKQGIIDKNGDRGMLCYLSRFLPDEERKYLEPLHERLQRGTLADRMVHRYHGVGLEGTYREIADALREDVKRG